MKKSYLMIASGATLWGLIGFFVKGLYACGFNSLQIVAVRVSTAALILLLYLVFNKPSMLKISFKDIPLFVGTGICSVAFFNWCYFSAIEEISVAVAAVLLYTAPAFVTIISRFLFHEWFSGKKLISLFMTLLGCSLVVGFLPSLETQVSVYGLLLGLGSGLGYALYSIFGKIASRKYDTLTITAYTFFLASLATIPISKLSQAAPLMSNFSVYLYAFGLGLIPTVLAYLLYTAGLAGVESSRASITATIEPVVAILLGVIGFGESLSIWQISGISLILLAVLLIQETHFKKPEA